jgi:hypothetical protein
MKKLPVNQPLLLSSCLGATLPLTWILFVIFSREPELEAWMLFPSILIPMGGAIGGSFFYLMGFHWFPQGKKKFIALLFSIVAYIGTLWISAVLAFALTGDWN